MKILHGFEFECAGEIPEAAFAEIGGLTRLVCEGMSGYILYSQAEWNQSDASDYEADSEGRVTFQGKLTGERLPQSAMEAAIP